jgi:hypothetical protein
MRSALETTDQPYKQQTTLLKVGQDGTPEREILVDLEAKDISAHWQMQEPMLWFVVAICCLYFFFILAAYG